MTYLVVTVFAVVLLVGRGGTLENGSCRMALGMAGRCVPLDECPRLKAISKKSSLVQEEINQLKSASNACDDPSNAIPRFCCGVSEFLPKVLVDVRRSSDDDPAPTCLQNMVENGASFVGASTANTSFGVYIEVSRRNGTPGRCVGSLITAEYVLTAAHCIRGDHLDLYVNANNLGRLQTDVKRRFAREIIIHEGYNNRSKKHDIALLRLNEPIRPENGVHTPVPICLPVPDDSRPEELASVGHTLNSFGWGSNAYGKPSDTKQEVTLERISMEECRERLKIPLLIAPWTVLSEQHLCTISISGHDAFTGYSGAPLMYRKEGAWFLAGVVSYGIGRLNNNFPVTSINLEYYTNWILNKLEGAK